MVTVPFPYQGFDFKQAGQTEKSMDMRIGRHSHKDNSLIEFDQNFGVNF